MRYCHHVEDVLAFHRDDVERAGTLIRLAGAGVPVHLADGGPGLARLIGRELHGLMTSGVRDADMARRERLSIRMRRIALRDFSSAGRSGDHGHGNRQPDPGAAPPVSILLPTCRPEFLPWALANVARQNYPRIELVIALHGAGFGAASWTAGLSCPVKVLRVPGKKVLGEVLNRAAAAASGTLLTKMDDDDLYGPDHVWDLVLAHEYSGAQVVGKGQQTTYLAGADQTIQYALDGTESYGSLHLGGGALLIANSDLKRAGGWRCIARDEDRSLLRDVQRAHGRIYRTHSAEYIVIRHRLGHAWAVSDRRLLARAQVVSPGFRPSLADIDKAAILSDPGAFSPVGVSAKPIVSAHTRVRVR